METALPGFGGESLYTGSYHFLFHMVPELPERLIEPWSGVLAVGLSVENILGHAPPRRSADGTPPHDVWVVNVEKDYHEKAAS